MRHVDEEVYQALCAEVDALAHETGLELVIGYLGDITENWQGRLISDDRRWTVWISNAHSMPSGNIARFSFFPTGGMRNLINHVNLDRLRTILRNSAPKAVCDLHGNVTVTCEQSAQLINNI